MAIDWRHDQPAVEFLRHCIEVCFPEVGLHHDAEMTVDPANWRAGGAKKTYRNHPLRGVGGYVNRHNAMGGFSAHSEGRAADIYVKIDNLYLKAIGDALFAGFVHNAENLGLEEVIWNRQIWSSAIPEIHAYQGARPHTDHVHVAFSRPDSQVRSELLLRVVQAAREDVIRQFPP